MMARNFPIFLLSGFELESVLSAVCPVFGDSQNQFSDPPDIIYLVQCTHRVLGLHTE